MRPGMATPCLSPDPEMCRCQPGRGGGRSSTRDAKPALAPPGDPPAGVVHWAEQLRRARGAASVRGALAPASGLYSRASPGHGTTGAVLSHQARLPTHCPRARPGNKPWPRVPKGPVHPERPPRRPQLRPGGPSSYRACAGSACAPSPRAPLVCSVVFFLPRVASGEDRKTRVSAKLASPFICLAHLEKRACVPGPREVPWKGRGHVGGRA